MKNPTTRQIEKWCTALRSGRFKQTSGKLQDEKGYCCLGVACRVFLPNPKLKHGILNGYIIDKEDQPKAPEWLLLINNAFAKKMGIALDLLNDGEKLTFDEIADCLELVFIHKALD